MSILQSVGRETASRVQTQREAPDLLTLFQLLCFLENVSVWISRAADDGIVLLLIAKVRLR